MTSLWRHICKRL